MAPGQQDIKQTPLYSLHLEFGARMVPFAGYAMPVQYPAGIKAEHEHTRKAAGLFDISHMGQIRIEGEEVASQLEALVPGDINFLKPGRQRYTLLTNDEGGIIDDLMVTRMPDHFFLVVNAARKVHDFRYLQGRLDESCRLTALQDRALLALQGPEAAAVMAGLTPDISGLPFLGAVETELRGVKCLVHRCGYTGEDGFEISMDTDDAIRIAKMLLDNPAVQPVGLGARDSLRLEAGLCLYGHDLDETTSPVEAALDWTIARKYRDGSEATPRFPGAKRILEELRQGPPRIRRGFRPAGKIPVREGTIILDSRGVEAGIITSGGYGPTLGAPIAMGYVANSSEDNTEYLVEIRNRQHQITRVELPFVKHRYYSSKTV